MKPKTKETINGIATALAAVSAIYVVFIIGSFSTAKQCVGCSNTQYFVGSSMVFLVFMAFALLLTVSHIHKENKNAKNTS